MSITSLSPPPASSRAPRNPNLLMIIGGALVLLVAGFIMEPKEALGDALAAAIFCLTIPLGAALLMAICIAIGARWWHGITKFPTQLASLFPITALAVGAVLLAGLYQLYPWTDADVVAHSHILQLKAAWLTPAFFLIRAAVVLVAWFLMIAALVKAVNNAVNNPSAAATGRMVRTGVVFILVFGLTISVAWWDWLMSLEPEWFSTMQGVYGFSSVYVAGIAATIIFAIQHQRAGGTMVKENHLHDLGKLLFAFSFFWGYIWFCQFMLIWYADIPEEAGWFVHRMTGGWTMLFVLNGVINFAVPFIVLMSAKAKKNPNVLYQVALLALAGRWLDLWLAVAPSLNDGPYIPVYGIAATALVLGLMALPPPKAKPA